MLTNVRTVTLNILLCANTKMHMHYKHEDSIFHIFYEVFLGLI